MFVCIDRTRTNDSLTLCDDCLKIRNVLPDMYFVVINGYRVPAARKENL